MTGKLSTKHRADKLRALLDTSRPAIAMASHNALSAKLVEEAGFDAVWVSGFEISASHAVPDASILPMSVNLEITRAMGQVTKLPLVVDIDTGFGNAVNVAYSVPQFEAAGASAVVLEDKMFPKDSSLRSNGRHILVTIPEFQGKIASAKTSSSLLVIARTEALIAGLGQDEALRRAKAYVEAGADAILVHSKQKTPAEILAFIEAWDGSAPLVIVPTNYPSLGFDEVAALSKVGLIICGNHAIRAAMSAMRRVFATILQRRGLGAVEGDIASVSEVFELQGDAKMRGVEKEFLRTERRRQLDALLPPDQHQVCAALWGLGGSGKTQIALEFAYQLRSPDAPGPRSVSWVHVDSEATLAYDYKTIAAKLGVNKRLEGYQLFKAVRDAIQADPSWVLVLDNADDLALFSVGLSTGEAKSLEV